MLIRKCRICDNKNITPFFDLGFQPLANSLVKNISKKETHYPLSLVWCSNCSLVQLNYTVDPHKLFSSYFWLTAISPTTRQFAETFCDWLLARCPVFDRKKDYIVEVASNDGTFLKPFLRRGCRIQGVDPAANVVKIARKEKVPTKRAFWGEIAARQIFKKNGPAKIIFARNVLAHVANPKDFMTGLALCLDQGGVLAIEVHYGKVILEELQYDSIYHEHLFYFTLKPLEKLLNQFNLFIFDIAKSPISGGALIVYAKKGKIKEEKMVQYYRDQENKDQANNLQSWQNFAKKVVAHRQRLIALLGKFTSQKRIIGWGSSARGSTLLNFCGIDSKLIPIIADNNPLKHQYYTAGTNILTDKPEIAMMTNPQLIVILAWNLAEEIIQDARSKFKYKGKFLIPLPHTPYIL